ncbi:hypothetical protein JY440_06880 [Stenotrophomonas maltophilia]|nr:hypothetical protein [Stenotrophomonas maltophilia]MBN4982929.1 hypothetical protein [Stenotrophomonas maltophilia]
MQNINKKLEPWLYHTALGIFIALSLLHLLTGYADNGDFSRSAGFLFERPHDFSTMWPAAESEEWRRRFFGEWHDKWIFLKSWPNTENVFSFSSYKLYLLFQAYLSTLIGVDSSYYSIISGSILSRLILCAVFLVFAHHLRYQISKLTAWIFILIFGFILIDSSWIAFLNSFYEEQIAIVFLPILGFFLLKFLTNQNTKTGFWFLLCATFIGSAKTAYFYLPTLSILFLAPFFSSKNKLTKLILITILLQAVSLLPAYFGKYEKINSYHALYFGALKVLPNTEASSIKSIGEKPVFHECIGVSAFSPLGNKCMEKSNTSYADVVKLIGNHPSVGFEMIFKVFEDGRAIRLEYLGKEIKNAPNFSESYVFNIWPKFFAKGLNYFILLALLAASFLLIEKRSLLSDKEKSVLLIGVFFAAFGFSQYIVSLGDGYYEITKHLTAGNYALALSLPFIFAAIISAAQRLLFSKLNSE